MLNIKVFNQRDPRWANEQHGASNSTLGATGCTVSILASMLHHAGYRDIDPAKLNVVLTQNNGYDQGNLVRWHVIAQLFPKVKWVWRHSVYNNDLAREWIKDKGIMPIIEAGAAPIGGAPGGKHWIGFVGDRKSADPWSGKIVDTSTWSPTGMALYEYTPVEGDDDMSDEYGDMVWKSGQHDKTIRELFGGDKNPRNYESKKVLDLFAERNQKIKDLEKKIDELEKNPIVVDPTPEEGMKLNGRQIRYTKDGKEYTDNYTIDG